MIYILAMIVVLGVLVFVHELGHFLAAKLFGVRVERFSIGFPPRLFGKQIGETDYCISAVPLGGYVKLSGMIDESMDAEKMNEPPKPYEFRAKPTYQQVIIITAGVIMNFLLAVGIIGGGFWLRGEPYIPTTTISYVAPGGLADSIGFRAGDKIISIDGEPVSDWQTVSKMFLQKVGGLANFSVLRDGERRNIELNWDNLKINDLERLGLRPLLPAVVGDLSPGFPAEAAGLQRGDRIAAINDSTITSWGDMTGIISGNAGNPLRFRIERNGEMFTVEITPRPVATQNMDGEDIQRGIIGVAYLQERRDIAFVPAMIRGVREAILFAELNITGFTRLISGKESARDTLAGPLAIAKMAGDTAQQNLGNLVMFIAYLSIILAMVNILPIPALDGGHLVIILIEGAIKRPLSLRTKMVVQQIGMVFLLMLMVFVFYNDISRFLSN